MSSVSCVPLSNTSSLYCSARLRRKRKAGPKCDVLGAVMWTLGSLLVSFSVELNRNGTGILVSVTVANVLLILFVTILLGKGLKESSASYVLPWLIVSLWSMYQIQSTDIVRMYRELIVMSHPGQFAWIALAVYAISLLTRFHLTMTIAYVALQQWYNKNLAQEIKERKDVIG